jgi:hypothetical protein
MKVLLITALTMGICAASATEAPQPSVAQKTTARILQAFPYKPDQPESKIDPNVGGDIRPFVMLPKVIVQAPKPAILSGEDLLSKTELSALIRKKYPGASLRRQDPVHYDGGLPNYGALLYAEDKRAKQLQDLESLADLLVRTGDLAGGKTLRARVQEAAIRKPDALREAMDKSANNDRR